MSDDTTQQDLIIARLDTLIDAVNRLADAVLASGRTSEPVTPPQAPEAAPPPESPQVAPVVAQAAASVAEAGAAAVTSTTPPAPAPGDVEVIVDEHVVAGIPGPGADIDATLSRMFQAALAKDQEVAWRELTALTHPREMVAPRALDGLKAFSWKQLRKNASSYLSGADTGSYSVERTDPGELSADQERVKVFLQSPGRSPAPVTLRRDEASGGAWRLSQVSL